MSDQDNQVVNQEQEIVNEFVMPEPAKEQVEDYVSQLVGEDKKYKSVEELAKGTVHANQFIETLKAEKLALEEELNKTKKQEDHLQTIVGLLKPQEPKKSEAEEPKMEVKQEPQVSAPIMPSVDDDMNRQEFAKLAVEKYGNAVIAGEKLKEYIGGDKSKEEVVMTLMRRDPNALLTILPGPSKEMNPTGNTAMTGTPKPTLPLTYTEAMRVFSEDRQLYQSQAFQAKLTAAQLAAKQAGIKFENT